MKTTLNDLKRKVLDQQIRFLDELWRYFVTERTWPSTRSVYMSRPYPTLRDLLPSLGGDVVREVQSGGVKMFELTLVGIFLTSEGDQLLDLFVRCFEFLRKQFFAKNPQTSFTRDEVLKALRLSAEEATSLGLMLHQAWMMGCGGQGDPWTVHSSNWIEELPQEGEMRELVLQKVFQGFNPIAPVFLADAHLYPDLRPMTTEETSFGALFSQSAEAARIKSRKVFIVHGRNEAAREKAARLLEKLGLEPIILHEQPNRGRTIIEKFSDHSDVAYAVVLCTGDDIGGLTNEGPEKQKRRARQNVIFELGFFIGKLGRDRVCALYEKGVEIPSDYQGVVFILLDDAGAWKLSLGKEIKAAGLVIDMNKLC